MEPQTFQALKAWILEHMPWPYEDVGRDSQEADEAAEAVAVMVCPHLEREWTPDSEHDKQMNRLIDAALNRAHAAETQLAAALGLQADGVTVLVLTSELDVLRGKVARIDAALAECEQFSGDGSAEKMASILRGIVG